MSTALGMCGLCGGSCVVEAEVENDRIVSVRKPQGNPYFSNKICVRGAALKQFVHHPDRILQPMKRCGPKGSGEFAPISWEQAVDEIAQRLLLTREESGAKSTVFFAGHPKWYRKVMAELAAQYGSPNYCTESSTCNSAVSLAWQLICGDARVVPDVRRSEVHVFWSANPGAGTGDNSAAVALKKRGVRLIVVDPRVTAAADVADIHLQPYPGTDGALALGIAQVIISEGLQDVEYINKYTRGFDEFSAYAAGFTPERVSELTGVPANKLIAAARMMASGRMSLRTSSCAVVHCVNGVQNLRAVLSLLALTGNIGTPGGNLSGLGAPTAVLDGANRDLAARPDVENDITGGALPVWNKLMAGEAQCARLADVLLLDEPYRIRNLIMFGANTMMWPQSDRIREALARVEYCVVTELFWNEACQSADIVLPCCAAPERDTVLSGSRNHLSLIPKLVEPGDKLPDVEILLRLAHAMGLHSPLLDLADYDSFLNYTLRPTGVTLEELRAQPGGVDARRLAPPVPMDPERGFKTPSGKVEFCSSVLEEYSALPGYEALPVYHDWRQAAGLGAEYPFILCTGARRTQFFHSRTYRLSWLSGLEGHTVVSLNPSDAELLGVGEGERLLLTTPRGSMIYSAELDSGVKPGVAHVYHDDGDENINRILDDRYSDPISGFPGYRSYVCRLEKLSGESGGRE